MPPVLLTHQLYRLLKKQQFKYFVFKGCIPIEELAMSMSFVYEPVKDLPVTGIRDYATIDDESILSQLKEPAKLIYIEMN